MLLRSLKDLNHADTAKGRPGGLSRAFLGSVDQPELHRVHADRVAKLVHQRLGGEGGDRGAGRPVGGGFLGIDDHV